jgi:hypothetical protein
LVESGRGAVKLDLVNWLAIARILASARLMKVQLVKSLDQYSQRSVEGLNVMIFQLRAAQAIKEI